MNSPKTYIGLSKALVDIRIKLSVFWYFFKKFISGKISFSDFIRILKRLLFFLSKMNENKYVQLADTIKINLYVPSFPSKAFYQSCEKMAVLDKKMPSVSALISVTSACRYNCSHCYQRLDKGQDVNIDVLIKVCKNLQDKGVAFFNIEGGEPFLVFDKLYKLCSEIDERSEIIINTTGDAVTEERVQKLFALGNVKALMFSLHSSVPEELNKFTENENAWQNMVKAIEICHKIGMPVVFNSCLQNTSYHDGSFEKIMDVAKDFGSALIQLIKPKPAGAWLEGGATVFDENDNETLKEKVLKYNLKKEYKHYPFVYSQQLEEDTSMFGCTAGGTDRFYINAKGDLQPCEFLNISFGNIYTDNFDEIYNNMRKTFETPGDCWICEKYALEISNACKENNISILPLNKELSEKLISKWDRGVEADFYEKIKKI